MIRKLLFPLLKEKAILLLVVFFTVPYFIIAQGGNCPDDNYTACDATAVTADDECENPIFASTECNNAIAVWYSYIGAADAVNLQVSNLSGSPNNAAFILVYDGDCDALGNTQEVAGAFDELSFNPVVGTTYLIKVRPSIAATFDFCISACNTTGADDICDASMPHLQSSSTCELVYGSTYCTVAKTSYYRFEPAVSSRYEISSNHILNDLPCGLRIYKNACPDQIEMGFGLAPVQIDFDANEVYIIAVETYDTSNFLIATDFNLCISTFDCAASELPINDYCDTAIKLPVDSANSCLTYTHQLYSCVTDSGIPAATCADYGQGGDVWFVVEVPASGHLVVSTFQSESALGLLEFDSVLEAYSGDCDGLQFISCNDDGVDDLSLHAELDLVGLTMGEDIYVRAYSYSNLPAGSFDICARDGSYSSCPIDLVLTGQVIAGTIHQYAATETITSDQNIDGGSENISYQASTCIELLPGFAVAAGSSIELLIDTCPESGF